MRSHNTLIWAILMSSISLGATADIKIEFKESAPKDRFSISNQGDCTLKQLYLSLDLSKSKGQLIFDTTSAGAGVEVFQPFEQREGSVTLHDKETVADGDTGLVVLIENIIPKQRVSFTIDVDDTLTQSELGNIRVSGAEIAGSTASISFSKNHSEGSNSTFIGVFTDEGYANIELSQCS